MSLSVHEFESIIKKHCTKQLSMLDAGTRKSSLNIVANYDHLEPILNEPGRASVYPIQHPDIWDLYKKQLASFWVPEEIAMFADRENFDVLDEITQKFIKNILAFFATADGSVIATIADNLLNDTQVLELQFGYRYQIVMEQIHADMYGRLINQLIPDLEEKDRLFNAVATIPCISEKNSWGRKWAYSNAPYAQRLLANAIVEGVFFSGSFCAIYWIKKKNTMPGLCDSNEFISRDEGMHCEFAYEIYNKKIIYKIPTPSIHAMITDAVVIEKRFINESLKCGLIGMNPTLMGQYIEYVADVLLQHISVPKIFNTENPFDFMDNFSIQVKTNFFEARPTTYNKGTTDLNSDACEDDDSDF
jgi:ribonucleotide reductase beta subunit family protein with ferritin-like domain